MRLKTKFLCLMAVLFAVSLGANLVWTSANKHAQMENELRVQGRALAQQMDAVWELRWPSRKTAPTRGCIALSPAV